MLNSPDWKITEMVMDLQYTVPEDPFAVRVTFVNRKNAKKNITMFTGEDSWMKVAEQAKRQVAAREYYKIVEHEPKPIVHKAAPAPVVKAKGKKKA